MAAPNMSQREREAIFVWTVLTTREDIMHTMNLTEPQIVERLQPLSLDPSMLTQLVTKVYKEKSMFGKVRSTLMNHAAIANGGANAAPIPWGGSGVHPTISGLRASLGLAPATIDSDSHSGA